MARYVVLWAEYASGRNYYQVEGYNRADLALRRAGEVHGIVIPAVYVDEVISKLRDAVRR